MSKTGRINYRRGTRGTPKSERRLIVECVRREAPVQEQQEAHAADLRHQHPENRDVSKLSASFRVLRRSIRIGEVGHGHR